MTADFQTLQTASVRAIRPASERVGRPLRQRDLTRGMKAAKAAGLPVVATVIAPDGTIRLEHVGAPADSAPTNPFERWEAKRARAA